MLSECPSLRPLSRFEPQYVSEANFAIDANCQTACNFVTADNSTFESVITDYRQSNTTIEELLQESSTSNEDFAKLTTAGFAKFLQSGQLRHSHAMTQIVSKDARNATVNDGGDMGGGAGIDDQDGDSSSSAAGTPTTLAVATPTSSSEVLVQKLKEELRQALSDLLSLTIIHSWVCLRQTETPRLPVVLFLSAITSDQTPSDSTLLPET